MTLISDLQDLAYDLLDSGQVSVVIGYEVGPRSRVRPAFVRDKDDVDRLTWNDDCQHNLTVYLREHLKPGDTDRVAVVTKPADSRAINVLLAENAFPQDRLHVIGISCDGKTPVVYDTLLGDPGDAPASDPRADELARLDGLSPVARLDYWLGQFDRCIRCYACRQACPMCSCPTCLYERDDSLWVGLGSGLDEKRAFHLGRAFHLAGRCVNCNACEEACPVDIPIGLLNRKIADEMAQSFGHRAGLEPILSPITTILSQEEG
jgi:formate dehydrogenase subunit beta